MLPGTRFYYDKQGRYRGKASDYGPITQGFWSLAILAFLGYLAFEWLKEAWWFIALIVSGGAFLVSIGGLIAAAMGKRSAILMISFFLVSAATTTALVYLELIPHMARRAS